ncbi:hypothetical protein FPQ18DRAFT_387460 [Pyronema domesticum]|nr:hypothetical protein FPQ18DRAFT_387460 [Pyronema domesticum]
MTFTDSLLHGWDYFTSCFTPFFTSCFKPRPDTVTGFRVYGSRPENRVKGVPNGGRNMGTNSPTCKETNGLNEDGFELEPWEGQNPRPTTAQRSQHSHHSEFSWDPSIRGTKTSLVAIPEEASGSVHTASPAESEEALSRRPSEAGTITQENYTLAQTPSFYSLPKLSRGSTLRQDMFACIDSEGSQSSRRQAPVPLSITIPESHPSGYMPEPLVGLSAPVSVNSSIDTIRYLSGPQHPIPSSTSRNASLDTIRGMVDIPLDDSTESPAAVRTSIEILSAIVKEREASGVQVQYGRKPKVSFAPTPTPASTPASTSHCPSPSAPAMTRQLVGTPPMGLMKQQSPPGTPRQLVGTPPAVLGKYTSPQQPPTTMTTIAISDLRAHRVQQKPAQSVYPMGQGRQRMAASSSDDNFSRETRRLSVNKGTQRSLKQRYQRFEAEEEDEVVGRGDDEMEMSSPVDEQTPLMNFDLRLPDLRESESESYYYSNDTVDERLPIPTASPFVVLSTMASKHMDTVSPEDNRAGSGTCSPTPLLSDSEYEPSASPFTRTSGSILRVTTPDLTASLILADLGMGTADHEDSRDPFFSDNDEPVVTTHESGVEPTSPADDLIHYKNWRRSIDEQRRVLVSSPCPLEESAACVYDTAPNSPRDLQTYRRPSMDIEDVYEEEDMTEPSRSSSIRMLRVVNPDPEEPKSPVDKSIDEASEASDVSPAPAEIIPVRDDQEVVVIETLDEITTDEESNCDMDPLSASVTLEDQWFRSLVNSNLDFNKEDVVISYEDTLENTRSESLVVKDTESAEESSPSIKNVHSRSLDQPTPAAHNATPNISPSTPGPASATPIPTVEDAPTSDSPPSKINALSMMSPDSFDLWKRVIEHIYDSDDEAPDIIEKVEIATTVLVVIEVQSSAEVTAITEMPMVGPVSHVVGVTDDKVGVVSKDVTTINTVAVVGAFSPGGLDVPSDATRRWQRTTSGKQMLPTETPESFRLKNGAQISDDIKKRRDQLIQRANRSLSK